MAAARNSDSCSPPARKRQRFSSPFEEYLEDFSQEDLAALDRLEAILSQGRQSPVKYPCNPSDKKEKARMDVSSSTDKENVEILSAIHGHSKSMQASSLSYGNQLQSQQHLSDLENPFMPQLPSFTSAKHVERMSAASPISGFTSALGFRSPASGERSSSPEIPPEQDYSSWFAPAPIPPAAELRFANFASASSIPSLTTDVSATGFVKASNKSWVIPSHAALVHAEEKLKRIWEEEEADSTSPSGPVTTREDCIESITDPSLLQRPALHAVENSVASSQLLDSPSPAGYSRPSVPNASLLTPGFDYLRKKPKPFKSPLVKPFHSPTPSTSTVSPLNPNRLAEQTFVSAGSHQQSLSTPLADTPLSSFGTYNSAFVTPTRSLAAKRSAAGETFSRPKFVTPFKVGMRPGEPGRKKLLDSSEKGVGSHTMPRKIDSRATHHLLSKEQNVAIDKHQDAQRWKAFDLTKPSQRSNLATSGLVPQSYDSTDLQAMGINPTELSQITPTLALYYSFNACSANPRENHAGVTLGPSAALEELRTRGCSLATKPWVDNHWCLILWKLAGMVYLDPEAELDPKRKRWCWSEVICQLLYRYERELNCGSRPPLRLITTQDSPASLPMVLCVSNITWPEASASDDGSSQSFLPELEVTDGWYRLRAQVDQPLSRAIRRGVIRVGRKIAFGAARLSSERKDPAEILDAYNSTKLVIFGNSSQLAPWHAKLGFQNTVSTTTLNALTSDGGVAAVMDVVVLKIFPLAFIEFVETEDGKTKREGPRNETEEESANERWKRRREVEESKLRQIWEKKLRMFEDYAERLERRAAVRTCPAEDWSPSDDVEAVLDDLEENPENSEVLARVNPIDSGPLARLIREKVAKGQETISQEIEQELTSLCPPRQVRNFRVLAVQDACTQKRPANRTAQLTVWDVLNLRFTEEGEAGVFKVGQRFRITNLVPTQPKAWMGRDLGAEVYLCTRRDSRWTKIK